MRAKKPVVRALIFDVFGTVVDWRASIIREGKALGGRKRLRVDWAAFADAWRAGYRPAMARVRSGDLPWMKIDDLHRMILDGLLKQFSIRGLARLKKRHVIATLSNGNVALLVNMAKYARLPWDTVLSAELFHHYKPDPETYLGAAQLLGFAPGEVMMVAAHKDDLRAAKACGLRTAFVSRPLERGPDARVDIAADRAFDYNADDFLDLSRQLDKTRR